MIKTVFCYAPYAFFALALLTFVLRCRLGVRGQALWSAVLLACFSKFLVYRSLGGDAFNPELPEIVLWVWNAAYSGAVILSVLSLATCFLRLPGRVVILPILSWGIAAWGVYSGVTPPCVREVELAFDGLPAALDGYRILHVSDPHVSSAARRWRTEALVANANAAKPDLICVTGDIADGRDAEAHADDVAPLADLRATDGVWYVTGNHEDYGDVLGWRNVYRRFGMQFLRNECVAPRRGLALAGADDPACLPGRRADAQAEAADLFAKASKDAFRIFLEHRPSRFRHNAEALGAGLQLSGHTHGGIAPGISALVARFNGGFVRGFYREGRSVLHVSPGSGQWAGFPMRLFNDSEMTLIVLRRK